MINKNAIIVFLVSLFALVVATTSYMFVSSKSILLKTNLTCNFRQTVYLKDFIYKLDGTLKNNYQIDTNKVGTQRLRAIYQDKHGFYKVKTFTINVKDITPPTILVTDTYTVEKNSKKKLEDEILCADDYDDNVKCSILGKYNLKKVGTYNLKITATDYSKNNTTKEFTLNVVAKESNTQNQTDNTSFVDYNDVYKKYKTNKTEIGIDISKWQKKIDFNKLKASGVEFVILKIGGQKELNGKTIMDPKFKKNIEAATKANLKIGLYFYSYAKSPQEAKNQARFIIKEIRKSNYKIDLPIAFDWENWLEYNKFNISFNSLNNIAKSFIKEINSSGYQATLYSSEYYLDTIWFAEDYDNIWVANYGNLTHKPKYKLWQMCSDGKVDGINNYVDIDILYKDN